MTTLQKFKLLATQCAVAGPSPTRSPSPGPAFHLRRRRTLRHLLTRTGSRRREPPPDALTMQPPKIPPADTVEKKPYLGHTLKDLFVSSPPPPSPSLELGNETPGGGGGDSVFRFLSPPLGANRVRAGAGRSVAGPFRHRILRRAWRPALVSIPESTD